MNESPPESAATCRLGYVQIILMGCSCIYQFMTCSCFMALSYCIAYSLCPDAIMILWWYSLVLSYSHAILMVLWYAHGALKVFWWYYCIISVLLWHVHGIVALLLWYSHGITVPSLYCYGMFKVLWWYYGTIVVLWYSHHTVLVCGWAQRRRGPWRIAPNLMFIAT